MLTYDVDESIKLSWGWMLDSGQWGQMLGIRSEICTFPAPIHAKKGSSS